MIQLTEQLVPVKLNAEKEGKAVAQQFKVRGFPTVLFLQVSATEEGKEELVGQIVGFRPPEPFGQALQQVLQEFKDFPQLLQRYQDNPEDLEALGKLVVIYQHRQNDARAAELLAEGEKQDPENAKGHLTKAYNAVADAYQEKEEFDKAVPLFRKAAKTGQEPADVVYARLSIAVCYLMQDRKEKAAPELKAILEMPEASQEDKDQAQRILEWIEQQKENDQKADEGS